MTQSARHATFLLRHPRKTQGFREQLTDGSSVFEEGVFEKGVFAEGVFEAGDGDARDSHQALTMLWIPPGRFWMGSPPKGELERIDNEGPQHLVQLEGFFLSQTPITQAQWREVAQWEPQGDEKWGLELRPSPSSSREKKQLLEGESNTDQRPVDMVSWHDAMEFCNRLSQRTGRTYALPSEAQWEYACRAGTTSSFSFGQTIMPKLANYNGSSAYADGPKGEYREQTTPVGLFPANAWGLQDMHGNVWEWCLDRWHNSYEGAPQDGSAWLDAWSQEQAQRVQRGGSFYRNPSYCLSAYRSHAMPHHVSSDFGFRVACIPQSRSS